MLMASLPAPGRLFADKQTPLSRFRLEARLHALEDADRAVLRAVEDALEWRGVTRADDDDDGVRARVRRARAMTASETLRAVIDRRMEIRTCLAALRRRAAADAPPPDDGSWGYGRWRRRILRNWRAAAFGLDRIHPWIKEADRLLSDGAAFDLERLLLDVVDRDLRRAGALHQFDLEAVVVYVLRWSLFDRWSRYNAEAASRRFSDLLEKGLSAGAISARGEVKPMEARG